MIRFLALFGCLAAAFALFYAATRTPDPVAASAAPGRFSAARAMADIAAMAPAPHPIGSPANQAVRDHLLRRMGALGLNPRVLRAVGVDQAVGPASARIAAGQVEDLIGVLPGRDASLPAVALMAHYDSVPGSPGAADDITSVASILEMIRALRSGPAPARDVMVVFTDGEEPGLLGAHAFFRGDPAAARIGFLMNLEARGGGGRTMMFETSAGNGASIGLLQRTAALPFSNSLAVFVYKILPNDTDFTVAKAAGLAGFNYAFIGRQFDYHSPSSTIEALDQGAVQHMGDEVLPTLRALAQARTLPGRAPDAAYADVLGLFLLAYPAWAGWLVLALAGGLIGLAAARAGRVGAISLGGVAGGLAAGPLLLAASALALHLARRTTGAAPGWISYRPLLARFPAFEAGMALAGLAAILLVAAAMARGRARLAAIVTALGLGLAGSAFGGIDAPGLGLGAVAAALASLALGAPPARGASWIGLLAGGWIALLALQIAAPTVTPIIAWPLTLAACGAAITAGATSERRWPWVVVAALAVLDLAWLGGLFHTLLEGLDLPEALALVAWLAALAVWPLAWPAEPERRWSLAPGAGLLAAGLAVMLALNLTSPWSDRHPRAVEPQYLVEAGTSHAWRIAAIAPDAWTRAVLAADGGAIVRRAFPTTPQPLLAAPARPVEAAPPALTLARTGDGALRLSARPAPGSDRLILDMSGASVSQASLDGQPIAILRRPGEVARLIWYGSDQGFDLRFKPAGPGSLDIAYAEQFPAWPARARPLPSPPARDMAWDRYGVTVVTGASKLSW